jgi:hypothetical protein
MEKDSRLHQPAAGTGGDPVRIIDDNCVIHWRRRSGQKTDPYRARCSHRPGYPDRLSEHAYEDIHTLIADQGFTEGGKICIEQGTHRPMAR